MREAPPINAPIGVVLTWLAETACQGVTKDQFTDYAQAVREELTLALNSRNPHAFGTTVRSYRHLIPHFGYAKKFQDNVARRPDRDQKFLRWLAAEADPLVDPHLRELTRLRISHLGPYLRASRETGDIRVFVRELHAICPDVDADEKRAGYILDYLRGNTSDPPTTPSRAKPRDRSSTVFTITTPTMTPAMFFSHLADIASAYSQSKTHSEIREILRDAYATAVMENNLLAFLTVVESFPSLTLHLATAQRYFLDNFGGPYSDRHFLHWLKYEAWKLEPEQAGTLSAQIHALEQCLKQSKAKKDPSFIDELDRICHKLMQDHTRSQHILGYLYGTFSPLPHVPKTRRPVDLREQKFLEWLAKEAVALTDSPGLVTVVREGIRAMENTLVDARETKNPANFFRELGYFSHRAIEKYETHIENFLLGVSGPVPKPATEVKEEPVSKEEQEVLSVEPKGRKLLGWVIFLLRDDKNEVESWVTHEINPSRWFTPDKSKRWFFRENEWDLVLRMFKDVSTALTKERRTRLRIRAVYAPRKRRTAAEEREDVLAVVRSELKSLDTTPNRTAEDVLRLLLVMFNTGAHSYAATRMK